MPRTQSADESTKPILDARDLVSHIKKLDSNEAETRRRVERIFATCMGYDPFKHISREHAVHGVGDSEYCDFAITVDTDTGTVPKMLVEIKRVGVDLQPKHLKQAASYAINIGCEWILLTNSRQWALYHVAFGQPPITKAIESWDLLSDDCGLLSKRFGLVSFQSLKHGALDKLWQKRNVLTPDNLLSIILSERSVTTIRRELRQKTDVSVTPEEVIGALRRLLNEAALAEMERVHISLPQKAEPQKRKRGRPPKVSAEPGSSDQTVINEDSPNS